MTAADSPPGLSVFPVSVGSGSDMGGRLIVVGSGSGSATCSSAAKSPSASFRAFSAESSGWDCSGSAVQVSSTDSIDAGTGSGSLSGGSGADGMATRRRRRMDSGGFGTAPAASKPCLCALCHQSMSAGHACGCSAMRRIHGRQPGSLAMACSWSAVSLGLRIGSPVFLSVLIISRRPCLPPAPCRRGRCTRLRAAR